MFRYFAAMLALVLACSASTAQTRVFTYQGSLTDNATAASGTYQMQFRLFDAETGGRILQVISEDAVTVANGVFKVDLNFTTVNVADGIKRFLEIAVRKNHETDYTTLPSRQMILKSPYAVKTLGAAFNDEALIPSITSTIPDGVATQYALFGRPTAAITYTTGQAIAGRTLTINKINGPNTKLKIVYMETFERPVNSTGFNAQLFITVNGIPTYGNPGIISAIVFPVSNANFAYGQANIIGYVTNLPAGIHTIGVMVASNSVTTFPRYQYLLEVQEVFSFDSPPIQN